MSDRHAWTESLSPEDLARCRNLAELIVHNRRESLERLESFRAQARESGLGPVEEFLFQAQQSDQRVLESAEQLFSTLMKNADSETPHRDHLVDEEVAESFPASDPPTYSRIT